jgi:alpha-tubulin suppressor-like RCC1 family protein
MINKITLSLSVFLFLTLSLHAQCFQSFYPGYLYTMAVKSDGTLWAAGSNQEWQLGGGPGLGLTGFVQIGIDNDWQSIGAGYNNTYGIKTNGTLWAWGSNSDYQYGNGTNLQSSVPVQIGTETNWKMVSAGGRHALALKTDGSMWAWGYNGEGQLGDGTVISKTMPVMITNDHDWDTIVATNHNSYAIKVNKSLYGWGRNYNGNVGIGTISMYQATPAIIGPANSWIKFEAGTYIAMGMRTNHTLWAWGENPHGETGNGNNQPQFSPIQVGTGPWKDFGTGELHAVAIGNDGKLYTWGSNQHGQLAIGLADVNMIFYSPTLLSSETDWDSLIVGGEHAFAYKNNGDLWTMGYNLYGQRGYYPPTTIAPALFDCSFLGIAEVGRSNSDFLIYPNPTENILNIANDTGKPIDEINILDFTGKILKTKIDDVSNIDVNDLESGIYLIQIKSEKVFYSYRFIKK